MLPVSLGQIPCKSVHLVVCQNLRDRPERVKAVPMVNVECPFGPVNLESCAAKLLYVVDSLKESARVSC